MIVYNFGMTIILGIKLDNRLETATEFQKIVSEFGCSIHTRIGLHLTNDKLCSDYGIILLEVENNKNAAALEKELLKIDKIEIQRMIFH